MKKIRVFFYILWLELKRIVFKTKYFAEIDITDNCNLRCKHCYHFNGKEIFIKDDLPLDVWEKRFNNLYASGIRFVLLVGGEPALRKDILQLADKTFPFIYLITNGTIFIPKEFNHILFVSIDGNLLTNDLIRGKGVFAKVTNNYSNDKRVIINITVTNENYNELEDVVLLAKKSNFLGVVCNIYTPKIGEQSGLFITDEKRKLIINELNRVKSLYPDNFLLTRSMIKWYEFPDHKDNCYWGDEVFHFDVLWKPRRCFSNVDCTYCGCFAGSFQNSAEVFKNLKEIEKFII
ncbi:MAG: radical SAM protein [Candidatus Firestonebacteria bacterium]|nr:radical SAM protein [Candidatus Firestonebacteria bacterium]